ncbi:MFS transporter [Candidatus Uabimicrobium sp. HlEnr_7]|uniref:MFS transporter n=1 Tax=Candidatus Uabimicrobium helgolandensis TaxID=3095367 RepID=UPI0035590E7F
MSRGSDIDFAKFSLIFGFAKKEEICSAIREVALLQELGINKRLPHIMYERRMLSAEQIQAIFWGLYHSKRIRRYPTRIVYDFTHEDDQVFFEKASVPINDLIDDIRNKNKQESTFPQEFLIYCQDIQNTLAKKGFKRSLLSILNTKGYLTKPYKNLIPDIESKRIVLASPRQVKEVHFRRRCEQILYSALAKKKFKLKDSEASHALDVWNQSLKHDIEFKYSEILFFLGYAKRTEVHSVAMVLEYITTIEQHPNVKFVDSRARLFSIQNPEYKERYAAEYELAEKLRSIGLVKIDGSNILIYKNIIDHDDLPNDQSTASIDLAFVSGSDKGLLTHQKLLSIGAKSEKERRKNLFRSMFPYSLSNLGREFEQVYLDERIAIRKSPVNEANEIVQEWAQTQILSLQDETYQTEVVPLPNESPSKRRAVAPDIENTDYISLPQNDSQQASGAQTEYFSLAQATHELKVLSAKIEQNVAEVRSTKLLFWSIFCLYAGAAVILSDLDKIFQGQDDNLPLFSGMSTFIMCFPAIFWGGHIGKLADRGQAHKLILWGFVIHVSCMPFLPFCSNIYIHLVVKFFQAIGLVAAGIGTEFCVSRWYGIGERGKMLGVASITATVAAAVGFVLPAFFEGIQIPYVKDSLAPVFAASILWMVISAITAPFAYKYIRLGAASTEDVDDELPAEKLAVSRVPLLASMIYGIVQMGIFIVFLPTFEQKMGENPSPYLNEYYLASILALGSVISSYIFGSVSDRIGPLKILRSLTFLAIVCCILVPYYIRLEQALLIFFILGLVEGGLHPLGFSWLLESIDDEQYYGAATGAYTLYNSAGAMFGCLFCGIIFKYASISTFFLVLTIIFILYLYLLLISRTRDAPFAKRRVRGVLRLLEPPEAEI